MSIPTPIFWVETKCCYKNVFGNDCFCGANLNENLLFINGRNGKLKTRLNIGADRLAKMMTLVFSNALNLRRDLLYFVFAVSPSRTFCDSIFFSPRGKKNNGRYRPIQFAPTVSSSLSRSQVFFILPSNPTTRHLGIIINKSLNAFWLEKVCFDNGKNKIWLKERNFFD